MVKTSTQKKEASFKIYYGIKIIKMDVGMGEDTYGNQYAAISLFYPKGTKSVVEPVLREMGEGNIVPEVYIKQDTTNAYIAVLFKLESVSSEFIRKIVPKKHSSGIKPSNGKIEFIMTGEAEFEESMGIELFKKFFEKDGLFRLFIYDGISLKDRPYWGIKLGSYVDGVPGIDEVEWTKV